MIQVVVGICCRGNQILLAERPEGKPYPGYWEFPGGKIFPNESSYDALKRELDEELGIQVQSARHLMDHKHTYPDKKVSLSIWRVDSFLGEPSPLENQKLVWTTFDKLKTFRLLKGNMALIEKIKYL